MNEQNNAVIEIDEVYALERIKMKDAILEMMKTPEFILIFKNGYHRDEAARLAQAITNPEMQDEVDQRSLHEMICAIGHSQNYLLNIVKEGRHLESQMIEAKADATQAAINAEKIYEVDDITGDEFEVINDA